MLSASTWRCWLRLLRATHMSPAMSRMATTAATMIKTIVLVAISAPYFDGLWRVLGKCRLVFEDVFDLCPCLFGVALGLIGATLRA